MTEKLTAWILAHGPRRLRPLVVAFGVPCAAGVSFTLWDAGILTESVGWLTVGLLIMSWPLTVWVATQPTTDALHSDRIIMLRLSNMPDEAIIQSLVVQAALRLRTFAALTLGCIPPLAMVWVRLTTDSQWRIGEVFGILTASVPLLSLHAGVLFTLTAHGVAMGLRMRNGLFAIISGMSAGLVAMLPAAVVILIVFNATVRMIINHPQPLLIVGAILAGGVSAALPVAICRTVLAGVRMRGLPQELPRAH